MRVIVTGGAGFIGSAVCRYLIGSTQWSVLNLDKLTYAANLSSLAMIAGDPRYHFVQGDIADRELIRHCFENFSPNAVLNLAAESHVDRSIDSAADFINTNISGTFVLLEEARRYLDTQPAHRRDTFRFHHISTDEVFGDLADGEFCTEASSYQPSSPYAASKAAADHLVRAWGRTYGLPILITNCSNNYGPFQFPEKLIPLIILRAFRGESLPVYGTGENVRDWLHVEDHATGLVTVLEKGEPGSTWNVGCSCPLRNIELVEQICDIVDELLGGLSRGPRRCLISFVEDRPGHDKRYAVDATKLRGRLGWEPLHDFDSGLRSTVRWYLENESWWGPLVESSGVLERVGLRKMA